MLKIIKYRTSSLTLEGKNFLKIAKVLTGFFVPIFIFILIFLNSISVNSQTNSDSANSFKIVYIKSFSSTKDFPNSDNFLHKVSNFIFGETSIHLSKPNGIIALDTQNYFILDRGLSLPLRVDIKDSDLEIIKNIDDMNFPSPAGLCLGNDNLIYFTDSKLNKIYVVKNDDDEVKILNDSLELNQPTGIVYSKENNEIIVAETANHRLIVLDIKGNFKKYIGIRGSDSGQFNFPTYLWVDKYSNIYVNDAMNFRIQIYNSKWELISTFGQQGDGTGYFSASKGIATDSYGHIYIADALFHNVQIFDKAGNYLSTFGSKGSNEGEFILPSGIFIDSVDRIYVSDTYNSRIQVFQLTKGEINEKR